MSVKDNYPFVKFLKLDLVNDTIGIQTPCKQKDFQNLQLFEI